MIYLPTKPHRKWHAAAQRTTLICLTGAISIFLPSFALAQSYTISTFAGNYTSGFSGDGSAAASAALAGAFAASVDKSGNVFIADQFNNRIRKVDTSGNISTFAGTGTAGYAGDGAAATAALISSPGGVLADAAGNVYISDTANNVIRKVDSKGIITTIAGNNATGAGYSGDGAAATAALINHPSGIGIDSTGIIYFADTSNNVIREVLPSGIIATFAGLSTPGFSGDGGAAASAKLNNPVGIAVDRFNNIYIGDGGNNRVRVITNNVITTVAGVSTSGFAGDGGPATKARLTAPKGVAVDNAGNVYVADTFNGRIRVITTDGNISTIAGSGAAGSGGDGGPANVASLFFPTDVALDSGSGKLYIADNQNNVIRLLTPNTTTPVVTLIQSAGAFGAYSSIAPSGWIEIYGVNFSATTRSWNNSDFAGSNAPTSLDGISVSIGGQAAFVNYISANQINVQVPSGVAVGSQPLIVTAPSGVSIAKTVTVAATTPGLLTPPPFKISGSQYNAALFSDGSTYAIPTGAIAGVPSRPAKTGDVITFYGVGFGPVTPNIPAGLTVPLTPPNSVSSTFLATVGGVAATVTYAGLAPGAIGLYQFNVVVPNVPSSNLVPFTFTLGGVAGTQTTFIAVQN